MLHLQEVYALQVERLLRTSHNTFLAYDQSSGLYHAFLDPSKMMAFVGLYSDGARDLLRLPVSPEC